LSILDIEIISIYSYTVLSDKGIPFERSFFLNLLHQEKSRFREAALFHFVGRIFCFAGEVPRSNAAYFLYQQKVGKN